MWVETRRKQIERGILRETQTMHFFDNVMRTFKIKTSRALASFLGLPEYKISKYINGVILPGYECCLHIQDVLRKNGMQVDIHEIRPKR